jgi:hypothetical protein
MGSRLKTEALGHPPDPFARPWQENLPKKLLIVVPCLAAILFGDLWFHTAAAARLASLVHLRGPRDQLFMFWDAWTYATGILQFSQGLSPYNPHDLSNFLPFAYPPVFAWAGAGFLRILGRAAGWEVYTTLYVTCLVSLELLLTLFFLRKVGKRETAALLCLAPLSLYSTSVFWSGNIHILWYCAAMFAALPGLAHGRWRWYYLVTLLAAINQPVFVLLLLLPLFTASSPYVPCAITAAAAGAAYPLQRILAPELYRQFQETVSNHLLVSRDFGAGVFGMSAELLAHFGVRGTSAPAAIQVAFSMAVILILVRLRNRVDRSSPRWWALIAIAIVLANPRVMPYDSALGLVPACFFLLYDLQSFWLWPLLALLVVCTAGAHEAGFSLLLLAGFLAGARSLSGGCRDWTERRIDPVPLGADHG